MSAVLGQTTNMRCTDPEFIELWKTHKSAAVLAKVLKLDPRNIHDRRRRIEQRYNIRLEGSKGTAHHYKHLSPTEHAARRHLEVKDGVVLIFSDAHFWPGVRTTAFKALLRFIAEPLSTTATPSTGLQSAATRASGGTASHPSSRN
jgi:hypothetical protein